MNAYAPLKHPGVLRYLIGNACAHLGQVMLGVAIGWEIYERTGSALALGYVGLAQFIPVLLLALPAGQLADRLDRRAIMMVALLGLIASSLGLATLSLLNGPLPLVYGCLLVAGAAQAFRSPAASAILPNLVPEGDLSQTVTWNTSIVQFSLLLGPALAGMLIGIWQAATPIYVIDALLAGVFLFALWGIRPVRPPASSHAPGWKDLLGGLSFVKRTPLLLAAITLDMVAVLLGGAVALLPIFAKDILHVGPQGLGWLMAAPSLGAFATGVMLAHLPPIRNNGPVLLWVVAGFGIATIGFGLSPYPALSWGMLFLVGAFDMVSMVIRSTMLQHLTPDAMRGRVNAIHSVFVGTSNELGAYESGLTSAWWGATRAVVIGGIGTLAMVAFAAARWPQLRQLKELKRESAGMAT